MSMALPLVRFGMTCLALHPDFEDGRPTTRCPEIWGYLGGYQLKTKNNSLVYSMTYGYIRSPLLAPSPH